MVPAVRAALYYSQRPLLRRSAAGLAARPH